MEANTQLNHVQYEYDAFISYRHIPNDMMIAQKLHSALETFRTPKALVKLGFPERLNKIFRDKDELPTSSDLSHDIEYALERSRFLVVVASPESARSEWVKKEVEIFGNLHGYEKILILLTNGEPEEAFPPSLIRYQLDDQGNVEKVIEPLAADIRPTKEKTARQLLKVEKLRLIAVMIGCKFDDLKQRENERRRKRILSLLSACFFATLAFTGFVLWQLSEVSAARSVAVQNESTLYSALAKRASDCGDHLLGAALALEALPKDLKKPDKPLFQDAVDALYYAVSNRRYQSNTYLYPQKIESLMSVYSYCFFANQDKWAVYFDGGCFYYYDASNGKAIDTWKIGDNYTIMDVYGNMVLAVKHIPAGNSNIRILDIESKAVLLNRDIEIGEYSVQAGFSPDGKRYYIGYMQKNEARMYTPVADVFETMTGVQAGQISAEECEWDSLLMDFASENLILVQTRDKIFVFDVRQGKQMEERTVRNESNVNSAEFKRAAIFDGTTLGYISADGEFITVDLAEGQQQTIVSGLEAWSDCIFSEDGRYFVLDGKLYDMVGKEPIVEFADGKYDEWRFHGHYLLNMTKETLKWIDGSGELSPALPSFEFKDDYKYALSNDYSKVMFIENTRIGLAKFLCNDIKSQFFPEVTNNYDTLDGKTLLQYHDSGFRDPYIYRSVLDLSNGKAQAINLWVMSSSDIRAPGNGKLYMLDNDDLIVVDTGSWESNRYDIGSYILKTVFEFYVSPDGQHLLLICEKCVIIYDIQANKIVRVINGEMGWFSPYGSDLSTAGFFQNSSYMWITYADEKESGIRIFDYISGKLISSFPLVNSSTRALYAKFNMDETRLVVEAGNNVSVMEVDANYTPHKLTDLNGEYMYMDDERIVTSTSSDVYIPKSILIYDIRTGDIVSHMSNDDGIRKIIIDNNNMLIMGYSGVSMYNLHTGNKVCDLFVRDASKEWIFDFELLNDRNEIAVVLSLDETYTFICTVPYFSTLEGVYEEARSLLKNRTFDMEELGHVY